MNPQQKALLTAAFEALGPERVTRGLQVSRHSWNDCREHYVGTLLDVGVPVVNRSPEPGTTTRERSGRWPLRGWS